MIQRAGKGENSIGFLSTDWDKLAQEVNQIKEKYNTPKEQRLNIAKQTAGSMYSQKNQHRIEFLDGNSVPVPEQKQAKSIDPTKNSRMPQSFDPENRLHTSKQVARMSANSGGISDIGGPSRQIQRESASIWENDKLQRMAGELDSKTRTLQEKEDNRQTRRSMRQESYDRLVDQLQSVDTRKASQITSASDQTVSQEQSRFGRVSRNISIFDCMNGNNDFNNLPEKTAGEKVSQERSDKSQQRDDSWRGGGRVVSSKGSLDRLFDALSGEK